MENPFDEMRRALGVAADVQRAADVNAERMATMLAGRLRHVDRWTLATLKRELDGFDATRKCWKDQR